MVRFYFSLLLLFACFRLSAQVCVPDTLLPSAGIYPDSAAGIPEAYEGQYYSLIVTARAPYDTIIEILGSPKTVLIDSIVFKKMLNAPSWFTYACEPPSCGFEPDSIRCALFSGVPPIGSAGTYVMDLVTVSYGKLQGIPQQLPPQIDTSFAFYSLVVNLGTALDDNLSQRPRLDAFPLPASSSVNVIVNSNSGERYRLWITDMAGRTWYDKWHIQGAKYQPLAIETSNWPPGIYYAIVKEKDVIYSTPVHIIR